MENKKNRIIVIGDVHGCFYELTQLLDKLKFTKQNDQLIFCGDLINRGPNSYECIQLFNKLSASSVLGNHEYFLLKAVEMHEYHHNVYIKMKSQFGNQFDELISNLKNWPLWIDLNDYLIVHAGINSNLKLTANDPSTIVSIRTQKNELGIDVPWFDSYYGIKTIIFGHWAKLNGIIRKNVIGLDMGCVYGNRLRAIILPTREIVEVAAAKRYFPL